MSTAVTYASLAAALLLAGAPLRADEPPTAPPTAPPASAAAVPAPPPAAAGPVAQAPAPEINQAQQLIFMNDLMGKVPAGGVLEYRFTRRGKDMKDYQDKVTVTVSRLAPDGRRDLAFDFLSGGFHLDFHPATNYRGNPVPIHFLERDIKEMSDASEGDIGYFRNRLRKAFTQPQIQPVKITFDGREIDGTQVTVTPYVDDPNIARFKTFANKRYDFLFAEEVPGGVYQIRTTVPAEGGDGPVIEEQLTFDHLTPPG